jgi:hypothetical protein
MSGLCGGELSGEGVLAFGLGRGKGGGHVLVRILESWKRILRSLHILGSSSRLTPSITSYIPKD